MIDFKKCWRVWSVQARQPRAVTRFYFSVPLQISMRSKEYKPNARRSWVLLQFSPPPCNWNWNNFYPLLEKSTARTLSDLLTFATPWGRGRTDQRDLVQLKTPHDFENFLFVELSWVELKETHSGNTSTIESITICTIQSWNYWNIYIHIPPLLRELLTHHIST